MSARAVLRQKMATASLFSKLWLLLCPICTIGDSTPADTSFAGQDCGTSHAHDTLTRWRGREPEDAAPCWLRGRERDGEVLFAALILFCTNSSTPYS
ncbi:hypothetical protein EDB85DRAFT_228925 [Lactarius pseudohatsudake]|nr:hypothetical protein EDB85DRAFT_228925 [Lactarius pseudohatsudake]